MGTERNVGVFGEPWDRVNESDVFRDRTFFGVFAAAPASTLAPASATGPSPAAAPPTTSVPDASFAVVTVATVGSRGAGFVGRFMFSFFSRNRAIVGPSLSSVFVCRLSVLRPSAFRSPLPVAAFFWRDLRRSSWREVSAL